MKSVFSVKVKNLTAFFSVTGTDYERERLEAQADLVVGAMRALLENRQSMTQFARCDEGLTACSS